MAVIRNVAARSAHNSATVEEYAARLNGRLEALARTQVILTREAGVGGDLETIVRDELLNQTSYVGQVDIQGPPVRLSAKAIEVLTLAVHKLVANAINTALCPKRAARFRFAGLFRTSTVNAD